MQPHIERAHAYWKEVLSPGDRAIDATCGNGHDTFFLANLGVDVIAYDIQLEAINATQKKVPKAQFRHQSHAQFVEEEAALVVYNLGYLPGGNKELTTQRDCTLQSVQNALQIAKKAVSITCYPGHPEGVHEEALLLEYVHHLDPKKWRVCHHRWLNRLCAPSLLWLEVLPLVQIP